MSDDDVIRGSASHVQFRSLGRAGKKRSHSKKRSAKKKTFWLAENLMVANILAMKFATIKILTGRRRFRQRCFFFLLQAAHTSRDDSSPPSTHRGDIVRSRDEAAEHSQRCGQERRRAPTPPVRPGDHSPGNADDASFPRFYGYQYM